MPQDSSKTSYERDNLFGGDYPVKYGEVEIGASETLVRGTVLGIITASGYGTTLDIAAADGSENFWGILTEDVTTGVGETKMAPAAIAGSFQSQALVMGGATTIADIKEAARALNCYIDENDADANVVGG